MTNIIKRIYNKYTSPTESREVRIIEENLRRALEVRHVNKIRYDAHVVIVEGQRETLMQLEKINKHLLEELTCSEQAIGMLNHKLQVAITDAEAANGNEITKEEKEEIRTNLKRLKNGTDKE